MEEVRHLPSTSLMGRAFNTSSIRVVTIEGNPWFVASDVCEILGFAKGVNGSFSNRLTTLDACERALFSLPTLSTGREGPAREQVIISESGLYKLVMRSKKPQAKAFQDWVSKVVLPSIRKTGSFVTGQPSLVENPQMSKTALAGQPAASRRAFQNARVRSILTALVVQ